MVKKINTELPKILIVDDKASNTVALERILENLEVNLITALSGKEALSKAMQNDFALILMDVQMPIMDGFETAEILIANKKTKEVPIIFVTAINKEEKDVWKGYESGALDYIFKPVESVLLKSKVKIFIEIYQKKEIEKRYLKLKQSHDSLKEVFKKQGELEKKAIAQLYKPLKTAVSSKMHGTGLIEDVDPEFFKAIVNDFKMLIEKAIEVQVFKVNYNMTDKLNAMAVELGSYRASPRDVLRIYIKANEYYVNQNQSDEKIQSITNESKLIMIELLGYLLSFYRAGYL